MKKTDIAMIILIASASIMVAYFVANSLPMFQDVNKPMKVKVATPISKSVEEPDPDLFNSEALNPTVKVIIGGAAQPDATSEDTTATDQPDSAPQGE